MLLGRLFLTFLKIGGTLYGSGYVLLAFLRNDFVERTHWITSQQLLDAVSVGQFTPGPVFTTATFVGYLIGGVPGAVVATVGIFLPSFVFVALTGRLIPRLRASRWTSAVLDGVNVAALGLMAGVTIDLGRTTFLPSGHIDVFAIAIAVASAFALIRWRVNSTWVLIVGAALGVVAQWMR
jgi:chromate transporter